MGEGADDDLAFAGAAQQAELIRTGAASASEVVAATLARIERIEPKLNAYCQLYADEATAAAAQIDAMSTDARAGKPMLGVPVAIKDSTNIAGRATAWGAPKNDAPQAADDHVVARLREAGAVVVGKTTCSELTIQPFTETVTFGATRNPWDLDRSPGGSSGGSGAAVAAGLCGVALGSDGLGSIRIPSAFSGVVGLKPHRERIPSGPKRGPGWLGLSVVGPIARRVRDAALFMDATADDLPDRGWLTALDEPMAPLRIALAWKPYPQLAITARIGDEQRRGMEHIAATLRSLGHDVEEHEVDLSPALFTHIGARYSSGIAEDLASLPHPEVTEARSRQVARWGRMIPDRMRTRLLAAEDEIRRRANAIFEQFDLVLTPSALGAPWPIGAFDGLGALRVLNKAGRVVPHFAPSNVIGQPAIVVPAGFDRDGLPLSAQFLGQPHGELALLRVAHQLEGALQWPDSRPAL